MRKLMLILLGILLIASLVSASRPAGPGELSLAWRNQQAMEAYYANLGFEMDYPYYDIQQPQYPAEQIGVYGDMAVIVNPVGDYPVPEVSFSDNGDQLFEEQPQQETFDYKPYSQVVYGKEAKTNYYAGQITSIVLMIVVIVILIAAIIYLAIKHLL